MEQEHITLQSLIEESPSVELRESDYGIGAKVLESDLSGFMSSIPPLLRKRCNFWIEDATAETLKLLIGVREDFGTDSRPINGPSLDEVQKGLETIQAEFEYKSQFFHNLSTGAEDCDFSTPFTIERTDTDITVTIPLLDRPYHETTVFRMLQMNDGVTAIETSEDGKYITYTYMKPLTPLEPREMDLTYSHAKDITDSLPLRCKNCSNDSIFVNESLLNNYPTLFVCKQCHSGWLLQQEDKNTAMNLKETYESLEEYQKQYMNDPLFEHTSQFADLSNSQDTSMISQSLTNRIGEVRSEYFVEDVGPENQTVSVCVTEDNALLLGLQYPTYTQYIKHTDWDAVSSTQILDGPQQCTLCSTPLPNYAHAIPAPQCIVPTDDPDTIIPIDLGHLCVGCHQQTLTQFKVALNQHKSKILPQLI